jgi:hypothetical protein
VELQEGTAATMVKQNRTSPAKPNNPIFWRTTKNPNQNCHALKMLNCTDKEIKSRVDYPNADRRCSDPMITDETQLQSNTKNLAQKI